AGLDLEDARLLARYGLNLPLLVDLGLDAYALMVGVAHMRIEKGRRWVPDPTGHRGFVSPVRGRGDRYDARDPFADEIVINGPLLDLVAWHPEAPRRWAVRTGAAEWLGAWCAGISHDHKEPVRVWRGPLGWLRGWLEGVVPLTTDRFAL